MMRPAPTAILLALAISTLPVATLVAQQRNPSGGALRPEQACYDVQHYDLTLAVDPELRAIEGVLVMTAKVTTPTRLVLLDLDDRSLSVRSVRCGDAAVQFEHRDDVIRVPLPREFATGEELRIAVAYGGNPVVATNPPWNGGFTWKQTKDGSPWIATSCQCDGADLWWPCKDHPSDKPAGVDLHITVPAKLYCAGNGKLVSDVRKGKLREFHWRVSVPISNYCIALNIAPYVVVQRTYTSVTGEKVPAFFFALPESEAKAQKAFPQFLGHLRFMEETCGPYPFRAEKYAVVETPFLGMEHQTIIAYGNQFQVGRDGYDWLHHHEMSHEWWGNLVTCRDWKDMWIHEGIGTYMQALYLEKLHGRQGYQREMLRQLMGIADRAAVAPREVQDSLQIYSGHDIYAKGAWVMHTLRWVMGDAKFFVALRRMAYPDPAMEKVTDGSCCRLVDSEEIRRIAEKYHGTDLGWFFDVYLHQPGPPKLVTHREKDKLVLDWVVEGGGVFPMPVPVRVGDKMHRVPMPNGHGELAVASSAAVDIDPDRAIYTGRPGGARPDGKQGRRRRR